MPKEDIFYTHAVIANSDKFGINGTDKAHMTEIGSVNGEVSGNGEGITSRDALAIQKSTLKLIDSLPLKKTIMTNNSVSYTHLTLPTKA